MFLRMMMRGLLVAGLAMPIGLAVSGDAGAQTAKNLKCKGCVGSKDIGKNAVREKHIKSNAVTSAKIKNGTIKAEDIAAGVLSGGAQVLSGGFNQGAAFANGFTGPGWTTTIGPDYPDTGDGEAATQMRMPAGTLGKLRVHVQTQLVPIGGNLIVMVRINGADTALTCTVTGTGDCTSNASVSINDDDRLALEITSTLNTEGNWTLTYTIQFS